jgi:DNA-binding response OmpR family regulator
MKRRILVVEDDRALVRILRDNLAYEGFEVACVEDGSRAVLVSREFVPDLILLDLMLPDRSGFELCGILGRGGRTPIIILTARGQKADKIRGLRVGADDYVTKPFEIEELLARIRAVLRRANPPVDRLALGDVVLDFRTLKATRTRSSRSRIENSTCCDTSPSGRTGSCTDTSCSRKSGATL